MRSCHVMVPLWSDICVGVRVYLSYRVLLSLALCFVYVCVSVWKSLCVFAYLCVKIFSFLVIIAAHDIRIRTFVFIYMYTNRQTADPHTHTYLKICTCCKIYP